MKQSPTVSVLMTSYNREQYIAAAIESVLSSTFTDFELIIVDDCSKDFTAEIASLYAKKDPRIQLRTNEKNLGDYYNRNKAASLANGEYLKYLDSDDIIYPYGLQMMVECMRTFPDAGLGLSRPACGSMHYPARLNPREAYAQHFLGDGLFNNAPSSTIIRRQCFVEVGGFSGKRFVGDFELWLALARRYSVVLMPMGLTWWRSHNDQEMTKEASSRSAISVRFELRRAALECPNCPLSKEQVQAALRAVKTGHAQEILSIIRRGHFTEGLSMFSNSRLGFLALWRGIVASLVKK